MGIAVGVLLLALSAATLYTGITAMRRNRRYRTWPETRARMLRSEVVDYRGAGADPGDVTAAVEYGYTVAGRVYRSRRIYVWGERSWGGLAASQRAARLLRGLHDGVPVRYDPDNPKDAALLPLPAGWIVLLLAGAAILLVAALGSFAAG